MYCLITNNISDIIPTTIDMYVIGFYIPYDPILKTTANNTPNSKVDNIRDINLSLDFFIFVIFFNAKCANIISNTAINAKI